MVKRTRPELIKRVTLSKPPKRSPQIVKGLVLLLMNGEGKRVCGLEGNLKVFFSVVALVVGELRGGWVPRQQ